MDKGTILVYRCPSTFSLTSPLSPPSQSRYTVYIQRVCGCDIFLWLDTKGSVSYSKIQVRAHNALKNELTVALDLLW
jgi:hypothetical protein